MAQITAAVAASPGWTLLRWFGRRLAAALLHGGAESDTLGDRACRDTSLPNQRGRREGEYHDQMGVVLKSDAGNPKLAAALRWRPAKAVKQGNGDPVQLGGLCHSPPHAHAATGGWTVRYTADIPRGRDTRSADHGGDGWTRRDETTVGTGKPKHQRTANRQPTPGGYGGWSIVGGDAVFARVVVRPQGSCRMHGPVGCKPTISPAWARRLRGTLGVAQMAGTPGRPPLPQRCHHTAQGRRSKAPSRHLALTCIGPRLAFMPTGSAPGTLPLATRPTILRQAMSACWWERRSRPA